MKSARNFLVILAALFASACSLALDLDSLSGGEEDSDTVVLCQGDGDCDDGVDCTVDSCTEEGTCLSLPDNDLCQHLEVCDLQEGCVDLGHECEGNGDCDDQVDCTVDSCIFGEVNECLHQPDDSFCDTGNLCVENESCHETLGCLPGDEVSCPQTGAPCMNTECDPADGECKDVLVAGADDDTDTYLDVACGGDDCADTNPDINPGKAETCNNIDDDCDGLTDVDVLANAVELATGSSLWEPDLSFDGATYGVVWRDGSGSSDGVFAHFVAPDGTDVGGPYEFTLAPGAGYRGEDPFIAAASDRFWVAWIASPAAGDPQVVVVDLSVNTSTGFVTVGTPTTLNNPTGGVPSRPFILWDDDAATTGSGWVASWLSTLAGAGTVQLQTQDMHSMSTSSAFQVDGSTAGMDGPRMALIGSNQYALTYAKEEASSAGSMEVFHTLITLSTSSVWENSTGYPALASAVDSSGDDPSFQASVTPDGLGSWILAFTDSAAGSSDQDINGWNGSLLSLVSGSSFDQLLPSIAWSGSSYGLMYIASVGTSEALQFLQLDDTLQPPASPYAGTRFDLVSGVEELRTGEIISDGSGGFATVWVRHDALEDHLLFTSFTGCTPPAK